MIPLKHQMFIWPLCRWRVCMSHVAKRIMFWESCSMVLIQLKKHWSIKIIEDKAHAVYFSHGHRLPVVLLTLNGRKILFVNHVKYLCVIFNNRITWRFHIEMIEAKSLRIFIRVCSPFKSERLSANIKLTLNKALIRLVITYSCPTWEFVADTQLLKLQLL
jgi:hypothetical protein